MKFSVCNEMFGSMPFVDQVRLLKAKDFDGIELSPFYLCDDGPFVRESLLKETRLILEGEGLEFAGIHWLLSYPAGFQIATEDKKERERAAEQLKRIADCSFYLGGGNLILGSPNQRTAIPPVTVKDAERWLEEVIREVAVHLDEEDLSYLCIEPLTRSQTNVVNSVFAAANLATRIASPRVVTMLDYHNTADETEDIETIIDEYKGLIGHVHANSMDGFAPEFDEMSKKVKRALLRNSYEGWISLEVFNVKDPIGELEKYIEYVELFKKFGI